MPKSTPTDRRAGEPYLAQSLLERIDAWYASDQSVAYDEHRARSIIESNQIYSPENLALLLAPESYALIELMAVKAKEKRELFFGNAIKVFTPFYISNFCSNGCLYCAFKADNKIVRKQLTKDELRAEASAISSTGIRQVLVLTGEAKRLTTFEYLRDSIREIDSVFSSVAMEVWPLTKDQYGELVNVGLDGLTLYQETYCRDIYAVQHPYGDKSDYNWRLEGPDRACSSGVRAIQIGALIGLDDYRRELGALAIHLDYLCKKYPDVEMSISIPRLRPIVNSDLIVDHPITDKLYAQILLAFRILFPHVGITLSTREDMRMRNGLIPLGVTKISAGVSTAVGEHTDKASDEQFDIADERSVDEMCTWLVDNGFQPVLHDWNSKLTRSAV